MFLPLADFRTRLFRNLGLQFYGERQILFCRFGKERVYLCCQHIKDRGSGLRTRIPNIPFRFVKCSPIYDVHKSRDSGQSLLTSPLDLKKGIAFLRCLQIKVKSSRLTLIYLAVLLEGSVACIDNHISRSGVRG